MLSLPDSLEIIVQLGTENGFTREEMAYIDVSVIERLYSNTDDIKFSQDKSSKDTKSTFMLEHWLCHHLSLIQMIFIHFICLLVSRISSYG